MDALIALMVERGYDDVTVQQILDRAGVGRSTFYTHFRDKEELLMANLENLRNGLLNHWRFLIKSQATTLGSLGFALPFFQHLTSNRHLYRPFIRGEAGMIFERQIRRIFAEMAREDIAAKPGWAGRDVEGAVQFIVGGLMSIMAWWLDQRVNITPEELNHIFLRLSLRGLDSVPE